MENIICIILLIGLIVFLVSMVYFAIQSIRSLKESERNYDVASYRFDLMRRCLPDVNLLDKIINKYTHEEMLQSSKPLEDGYWFTPEEIKEINNHKISSYENIYS